MYSSLDYQYSEDLYNIDIMTINGVHINYINAGYPINYYSQQGYLTVIESYSNYITVNLQVSATSTTNYLTDYTGDNVLIGVIQSTNSGYPDPYFYRYNFKKTYYRVKKINLVSTEIPHSEMLIKDSPPSNQNNILYWKILMDGDNIYQINITPGNYTFSEFQVELTNKINSVSRIFGSYLTNSNIYYKYCIANIIINSNNLFSLQIQSTIYLSKNISVSSDTYTDGFIRINVTHPLHNLVAGDNIIISGAISVINQTISNDTTKYYIPDTTINGKHIIESITGLNNYIVKLSTFNYNINMNIDSSMNNGGNSVNITYPLAIQLLFNYSNTFGSVLGFTNIGDQESITIFSKTITNKTPYINSTNLNSVGLPNYNNPLLNFITYPYILMVSDIFNSNINYKDSTGVFAKLFLSGTPGSIIYDQYVQIIEKLPAVVMYLNYIEFRFITPDGKPYNFNGSDHSYTLEFYEEFDDIENIDDN
jgi:hypothetical protein